MNSVKGKLYNCFQIVFLILLFSYLCAPAVFFICGEPKFLNIEIRENRKQEKMPSLRAQHFSSWPHSLENYITDNLGLRRWFIASQMRLFEWYLYSPVRYSLRGEKYGLYALGLIRSHISTRKYEKERLFQLRALFAARQAYLKLHGIAYLLIIPPDKESVLGDDIAWWFPYLNERYSFMLKLKKLLEENHINFMVFDSLFASTEMPWDFFFEKQDLFHWSYTGYMFANEAVEKQLETLLPSKSFANTPVSVKTSGLLPTPPYGSEIVPYYYQQLPLKSFTAEPFRLVDENYDVGLWFAPGSKITNYLPGVSGTMVIAHDSFYGIYGVASNRTFIGAFPPWACNFKTIYSFDRAEFSLQSLEKIIGLQPLLVVDAHCERTMGSGDAREAHIQTMLLGEKFLGNLRFVLQPDMDITKLIPQGPVKIETGMNKGQTNLSFQALGPAFIELPPIEANREGYAVIAARIQASNQHLPKCQYREPGGEWRDVPVMEYEAQRYPDIIYAQVLAKPEATLEIRLFLPESGTYPVLPLCLPNLSKEK